MNNKKKLHNAAKMRRILDKAAHDSAYKKELLRSPEELLKKEGVELEKKKIICHENTEKDFYIIIPTTPLEQKHTLSTLPKNASLNQIVRFIATQVQTNSPLKSKLLKAAHEVLKELGVSFPHHLKLHVYEATADEGHLVIPREYANDTELNDLEMSLFAGGNCNLQCHTCGILKEHPSDGDHKPDGHIH